VHDANYVPLALTLQMNMQQLVLFVLLDLLIHCQVQLLVSVVQRAMKQNTKEVQNVHKLIKVLFLPQIYVLEIGAMLLLLLPLSQLQPSSCVVAWHFAVFIENVIVAIISSRLFVPVLRQKFMGLKTQHKELTYWMEAIQNITISKLVLIPQKVQKVRFNFKTQK